MSKSAWWTAVVLTAAVALGPVGCGDDEPSQEQAAKTPEATATATAAASEVAPEQVTAAIDGQKVEAPSAKPNVLGGTGDINRILNFLDKDLTLFFSETLEPVGAKVSGAEVRRSAGPCDGENADAGGAPRWCAAEKVVFESPEGASAMRSRDGVVPLYLSVGWAHAQSAGAELGWQDGVKQGKYKADAVNEAQFCLFIAWVSYMFGQGVFENSDLPEVNRTLDGSAFSAIPGAIQQKAMDNAMNGGSTACVGS
jgi:hypothetical protein